MSSQSTHVLILAGGQGRRMHSSLPKVLFEIAGRPILLHILDRVEEALDRVSLAIIVGNQHEQVKKTVESSEVGKRLRPEFILQEKQNGTGDAARVALESRWGREVLTAQSSLLVLPGDFPLLSSDLIQQMATPLGRTQVMRLLTCDLDNPETYGRVVRRGKKGAVVRIVEDRDANLREKEIKEVGTSIYTFKTSFVRAGLKKLSNKNAQKEYYLPDLVGQASRAKKKIEVLKWKDSDDVRGVNNPWELALASRVFNQRILKKHSLNGVVLEDTQSIWIDSEVELKSQVRIAPGVVLKGSSSVGSKSVIGAHSVLRNTKIGSQVEIKAGTVSEESVIEDGARVGPHAHLRPGSKVGIQAKIGNFVELKNASVGSQTSVAHLSYLGDAEVGDRVNIGCGFVTCNFDGRTINGQRKHRTVIEDDVFIGSDCQVVAPIKLEKGSYVASGSTLTKNVSANDLAIARSRQVNKAGYAMKLRSGLPAKKENSEKQNSSEKGA